MTADLDAAGTPEQAWRSWSAPSRWPPLQLPSPRRVVVAAPHPDDETLGVGGTLATMAAASWRVEVVAVTDGEASHPHTDRLGARELAALRRAEQHHALRALGVDPGATRRLGLPDGHVAAHVDVVAAALTGRTGPDDWLLAPWEHDGHPDHDAVGAAAILAAAATGARLWRYPVWAWHWARPGDPVLAAWRPSRLDLDPAARAARDTAVGAYASQTRPLGPPPQDGVIVDAAMLERHRRGWEVLLA